MAYSRWGRASVEYRGMNMSGVRVTKDLLIEKRAERAFLKACAQWIDGLNVLSIVKPRSLVESRSFIEAPSSDSVKGRVGAFGPMRDHIRPLLICLRGWTNLLKGLEWSLQKASRWTCWPRVVMDRHLGPLQGNFYRTEENNKVMVMLTVGENVTGKRLDIVFSHRWLRGMSGATSRHFWRQLMFGLSRFPRNALRYRWNINLLHRCW